MAMKVLVVLSVLFACGMAVPQVPTTFYTNIAVQHWKGSRLTFLSTEGYYAQNHDRNMSIMCMNYTDERRFQLQTVCNMITMDTNTSDLIFAYYVKSADGSFLVCDYSKLDGLDFYGMFDWVVNSQPVEKCNDTCYQEAEQWEYKLSDFTTLSIGVTDYDPNIPVFSKYAVNLTDSEEQRYIYCFNDFKYEAPPYVTFDIPDPCQSSMNNALLRDPWNIKYDMAKHMQHQMTFNGRTHPQL